MMSREELRAELLNASGGSGGETAEAKEAALFAEMVRLVDVALRRGRDACLRRRLSRDARVDDDVAQVFER